MRVLLEIGYEDYLLPDETGLAVQRPEPSGANTTGTSEAHDVDVHVIDIPGTSLVPTRRRNGAGSKRTPALPKPAPALPRQRPLALPPPS